MNSISIIIPALDEEGTVENTIRGCQSIISSLDIDGEVIVIDDGSSDKTANIAETCGARVLVNLQNLGYGRALKKGIGAAKFDTIIICDADGTYPTEEIPGLLNEYKKGFNCVVGMRTGKHYKESILKMPLRSILRFLVEFTAGRKIPDINSGLRVFSKKEIMSYFNHLSDTFSFTTSQTLAYMMTGKYVSYLPIEYHKRIGKTKVRLFRDSLRTLQQIIQAILYYNPIKIFILLSLLCIVIGISGGLIGVVTGIAASYFFGVGVLTLSIIVFALGLISEQLRQLLLMEKKDEDSGLTPK